MWKKLSNLLVSLGTGVVSGGVITYSISGSQFWYWLVAGTVVTIIGIALEK
jgi:hypothetical protein